MDIPMEVTDASRAQQMLTKAQKEKEEYEEAYLTRLPVTKAEKHRQRKLTTLGMLDDFDSNRLDWITNIYIPIQALLVTRSLVLATLALCLVVPARNRCLLEKSGNQKAKSVAAAKKPNSIKSHTDFHCFTPNLIC